MGVPTARLRGQSAAFCSRPRTVEILPFFQGFFWTAPPPFADRSSVPVRQKQWVRGHLNRDPFLGRSCRTGLVRHPRSSGCGWILFCRSTTVRMRFLVRRVRIATACGFTSFWIFVDYRGPFSFLFADLARVGDPGRFAMVFFFPRPDSGSEKAEPARTCSPLILTCVGGIVLESIIRQFDLECWRVGPGRGAVDRGAMLWTCCAPPASLRVWLVGRTTFQVSCALGQLRASPKRDKNLEIRDTEMGDSFSLLGPTPSSHHHPEARFTGTIKKRKSGFSREESGS